MTVKYSKLSHNITTFSNPRPSKVYPRWDFWFEHKPSGNPEVVSHAKSGLKWDQIGVNFRPLDDCQLCAVFFKVTEAERIFRQLLCTVKDMY
jgi:hypothetical protein